MLIWFKSGVCAAIFVYSFFSLAAKLTVHIENVAQNKGQLRLAIYDDPASFLKSDLSVYSKTVNAKEGRVSVAFEDVETGVYGMALVHDLDGNGEISMGLFGPNEPYGFSNDAQGLFGPPSFEDAAFEVTGDTTIVITLSN